MDEQASNFIEKADALPPANDSSESANSPMVPFPSALVLTFEQEQDLIDHACKRIEALEGELGRHDVLHAQWWNRAAGGINSNTPIEQISGTFMGKRDLWERTYHNDVSWRPYAYPTPNIFETSNLVVPLSRRIVRQMVARAVDFFCGTDPWFGCMPQGESDHDFAEKVERYARYKAHKGELKSDISEALELAFVRGECVVKTHHRVRAQYYTSLEVVAVDAEANPLFADDGEYITESDEWIEVEGGDVLARDGVTQKPSPLIFLEVPIRRRLELFNGPESKTVFFKDFLCSLASENVQDAPEIVHLYDMPAIDLVEMYRNSGKLPPEETDSEAFENVRKAIDLLASMSADSAEWKSGSKRPRSDMPEPGDADRAGGPVTEIAEVWMRFDVDGDGAQEEILLVLDKQNRLPIFYDYTANVTVDGLRPFSVVKAGKVEGRWYGTGAMEAFDSTQRIVDLQVNRWNRSQGESGKVTFWNPSKTIEGQSNPNLQLNAGETYTPKPEVQDIEKEILKVVYLDNNKYNDLRQMIDFFLQIAMNESGVQHANDAQMAGMDTQKLATGIRNIEKSGQEMFGWYLENLTPGIEHIIRTWIKVLLANLDHEETFKFLEGRTAHLLTITPEEVRDIDIDVHVMLTRFKNEQQIQQGRLGSQIVTEYYSLAPDVQSRVTTFYRAMIDALDFRVDSDTTINPVQPDVQLPGQSQPPAPPSPAVNPEAITEAMNPAPPSQSPPNL